MILAGIDIGTNTLRLLVAEISPDSFFEVYSARSITRLGQGLDRTGMISPEAGERSLEALLTFSKDILCHAATHTTVIGTSALRSASNSHSFIHRVKQRTGLDIQVISGEEEARLTLLGVTKALAVPRGTGKPYSLDLSLVIDIGGGSTEMIASCPGTAPVIKSLPLGAVYLTERFIHHDPPGRDEIEHLRHAVRNELDRHAEELQRFTGSTLVGTAGTITTLAAIEQELAAYDPEMINGSLLTREWIERAVLKLGAQTVEERRAIRGLEQGREDIVFAGAVITQEIMYRFGYSSLLVSDWGLREGAVLDLHDRINKGL